MELAHALVVALLLAPLAASRAREARGGLHTVETNQPLLYGATIAAQNAKTSPRRLKEIRVDSPSYSRGAVRYWTVIESSFSLTSLDHCVASGHGGATHRPPEQILRNSGFFSD